MEQSFFIKNLVLKFLDQTGLKRDQNEVYLVLWKINALNISDFLHKITAA